MKKAAAFIFIIVFISACSIVGVHFKLHNPKRAGEYPEKTEALNLLGDQESKFRTCYDVKYYSLKITFGDELDAFNLPQKIDLNGQEGISGFSQMRFEAVTDLDTIQIDLRESIKLDYVMYSRASDPYHQLYPIDVKDVIRRDAVVLIVFPRKIKRGEVVSVISFFSGKPTEARRPPWSGGFVRKKDDLGNPWWGVACQTEGASTWWPCKDVVNDEPDSVHLILEVPNELMVVSNGVLQEKAYLEESWIGERLRNSYSWCVSYPINLYNITFYIGKYKLLHDTYTSKVTGDTLALNHYVLEQHYDKAVDHFKQLKDHLAVYEELFGPYPFYRDGFKLVESPYAGMEHQTAIAYGNKFKNNYLGFDYIILHETAHEWWGNSMTAYDLAEGWLHEGFATYAECLYVEKKFGYQAYLDYLRNYRWTIINRRTLVGPYGQRYFNYKDGDIYTKGAWTLHTLRETINNDSVFFEIIKTFATRYAYKNVTSKDFISVVNEKTGADYQWFFEQYLYNRFVPELEYCKSNGKIYYRWNRDFTNVDFRLPVVLCDTLGSRSDTIIPNGGIHRTLIQYSSGYFWNTKVLVKFTENKKLSKLYSRGRTTGPDF